MTMFEFGQYFENACKKTQLTDSLDDKLHFVVGTEIFARLALCFTSDQQERESDHRSYIAIVPPPLSLPILCGTRRQIELAVELVPPQFFQPFVALKAFAARVQGQVVLLEGGHPKEGGYYG